MRWIFSFIFKTVWKWWKKNNDNSRQSGKIAHETKANQPKWRADLCVAIIFFRFSFHLIVCFLFLATKPMSHLKNGWECNKYKANQSQFHSFAFSVWRKWASIRLKAVCVLILCLKPFGHLQRLLLLSSSSFYFSSSFFTP